MATGDAVDYKWYRYADNIGGHWSVKADKTWGDNGDSGFAASVAGDPAMVTSPALRPRKIMLQDPTSGRVTTRPVGATTAASWTTAGYTTTVKFRGLANGVVCTKIDQRDEHIRHARTINSKPEPAA